MNIPPNVLAHLEQITAESRDTFQTMSEKKLVQLCKEVVHQYMSFSEIISTLLDESPETELRNQILQAFENSEVADPLGVALVRTGAQLMASEAALIYLLSEWYRRRELDNDEASLYTDGDRAPDGHAGSGPDSDASQPDGSGTPME